MYLHSHKIEIYRRHCSTILPGSKWHFLGICSRNTDWS